jgi:hypothetical protein
MRLVAEFKRSDGKPVQSYRDYPLALTADIVTPSGKRTQVKFPLERGRNGVYVGEPTLEAPMEVGEYQVVLKVIGGGKYYSDYVARVQVKPIPYLLVDEPAEGKPLPPAESLAVRVRLMRAGKPLNPQEAFTNHPDYLIIAQVVESPEGQRGQAVWLNLAKEADTLGQFVGTVPMPETTEGMYFLAFKLAPEEPAKQAVADQTVLEVIVRRPPMPGWQKAVWTLIGVFGVGLFALVLWLASLPRMDCNSAEIYPIGSNGEGDPVIVFLANRKFALVRTRPYEDVKSRFFFFNGHKGEQQPITVRWFTFILPHMRTVDVGSDIIIGKHRIEIH